MGNSTLFFTGGHGYALALGAITGVYAGPLTLNPTTANVSVAGIFGGANITQLFKTGAGNLMLSGASTYTGGTTVSAGTLVFSFGASGLSGSLQLTNGSVCQVQTILPVVATNGTVSISPGSQLYLTNGVNLAVSNLVLGGVLQPAGSWGSSGSLATNQDNTYFSGPGILWAGIAPPIPVPTSPAGISATPGDGQVTLTWTASSGATTYNVKRSTINGGETTTTGTTTTNSYVDTNLVNGTTYYYVVSALNAGGESPNSVQVIARPSTLATITFTANDNVGSSSFSTGLHWSDGLAPSSNKEYVQGLTNAALRTPNGGGSITFAGHSLTLNNGGILAFKAANGSTITIGTDPATSLIMDIGFVSVFDGGRTESLGGFVTLNTGGGQFSPNTGTLPITAQIGGTGFLKVVENAALAQNGRVILSASNTYAGGTILDTADTLQLSGSGTLGATNGPFTLSDSLNRGQGTLDLNGTSQRIGNLTGTSLTGRIINSSATTASTLTIGNGDTGGGTFLGSIGDGSGVMALVKVGSGAITFAGTNSYSGDTLVEKGTLLINGLSSLSPITVSNGATLGGTGIIGGTVNIASGGNLAPGNAGVGVLTFTNNLTLLGNILMKINRSVAPSNDLCVINGLLTSGGVSTLTVTNLGPPLQTGDTFKLFSVPVGGFATVTLPALNTGSIWQNRLAVDGTIKVVARAFTNATALAVQWTSTNTLVLSWPSDHTGWRLQAQTNSLNVGIGVNWVEVAGASLTNQISIPLSTANDSVFFRLVYP